MYLSELFCLKLQFFVLFFVLTCFSKVCYWRAYYRQNQSRVRGCSMHISVGLQSDSVPKCCREPSVSIYWSDINLSPSIVKAIYNFKNKQPHSGFPLTLGVPRTACNASRLADFHHATVLSTQTAENLVSRCNNLYLPEWVSHQQRKKHL